MTPQSPPKSLMEGEKKIKFKDNYKKNYTKRCITCLNFNKGYFHKCHECKWRYYNSSEVLK